MGSIPKPSNLGRLLGIPVRVAVPDDDLQGIGGHGIARGRDVGCGRWLQVGGSDDDYRGPDHVAEVGPIVRLHRCLPLVSRSRPKARYQGLAIEIWYRSSIEMPLNQSVLLGVAIEVEVLVVEVEVVVVQGVGRR